MPSPEPVRVPVTDQPTTQLKLRDRLALSLCVGGDGEPVVALVMDDAYLVIPTDKLDLFAAALARCMADREAMAAGRPLDA